MTAYNIVRMRVKEGHEDEYMALHKQLFATAGPDMKAAGLRRFSLVKTGERAYCVLGEWESFDSILPSSWNFLRKVSRPSSVKCPGIFRHLMAMAWSKDRWWPRYTTPNPPSPIGASTR